MFRSSREGLRVAFYFLYGLFVLYRGVKGRYVVSLGLLATLLGDCAGCFFIFRQDQCGILVGLSRVMISFFLLLRSLRYFLYMSEYGGAIECLSLSRGYYVFVARVEGEGGVAGEKRSIDATDSYVDAYW